MSTTSRLIELLETKGHSQYGGEAVSQIEHALQAATLAEQASAPTSLIAAALLHDIGHLLHHLPDHAPDEGIDDEHEKSASLFLQGRMPDAVIDPIRLHVPAKRFLCAVDDKYFSQLSPPSIVSLRIQGGPMGNDEVHLFESEPFFEDAIQLRRWDDIAKDPKAITPPLSHFVQYLDAVGLDA